MPRRRGDNHLIARDFLNAPASSTQGKDIAHAGFIDHLLVELTHAPGRGIFCPRRQKDAKHSAVRNRAAVGNSHALRTGARAQPASDAVEDHAGFELREVRGGIDAGDQVDDGIEYLPAQIAIGPRAAHHGVPGIHV